MNNTKTKPILKIKPNAETLTNRVIRDVCDNGDLFRASSYRVSVRAYCTNEVEIRFTPSPKHTGDTERERENKFVGLELENGNRINSKKERKTNTKLGRNGWGVSYSGREFNRKTAQKIRRMVSSLQAKYGRKNLMFGTVTLPGSTRESMQAISAYSSYIVNRINKFCYDVLGKDARNRVQIWEFQRRGALHSHFIVASTNQRALEEAQKKFPNFCYNMFQDISKLSGIDMFERKEGGTWKNRPDVLRCDLQEVKKDASSYMSKYMSKNVSKKWQQTTNADIYYPVKWATWGRGASDALNQRTLSIKPRRISGRKCEDIANKCIELTKKMSSDKYSKPVVYRDLVGYGVNIKTIITDGNVEKYFDTIEELIANSIELKDITTNVKTVPIEVVWNHWIEEGEQIILEEDLMKKYGDTDARRWQKVFRNNTSKIPSFKSQEEWEQYWVVHSDSIAV